MQKEMENIFPTCSYFFSPHPKLGGVGWLWRRWGRGGGRWYVNSEPWFMCQNLLLLLGCFVKLQLVANNCLQLFLLLVRVSDIFGLFLRRTISELWLNICGQMAMFLWLACGAVQWVLLLGNLISLPFRWSCCIMCTALLSLQQGWL